MHITWKRVTDNDIHSYTLKLDCYLEDVSVPYSTLNCSNLICSNLVHKSELQTFYNYLVSACITAGGATFVKTLNGVNNGTNSNNKAGWYLYVQEFEEKALLRHFIWKSNGYPREGLIANIRRTTRAEYHKAVKFIHRKRESIVANNMANDLIANKSCDFWSAIKKIKKGKAVLPNCVDSCNDEQNISDLFASKYDQLYNCVSYNDEQLQNVATVLDKKYPGGLL